MGIYDRDHRQNDPWKKKNDSFQFNESKGEIEIDPNNSSQTSFNNRNTTHISEEAKAFNEASKHRRKYKDFDEQQKRKLKEFKRIWKLDQTKNKNLIWAIPWVVGLLIILAIAKEIHKHNPIDSSAITPSSSPEENIFEPLQAIQTPATSIIGSSYNSESATCPFTMIADNKNYYIKLCDTMRGDQTVAKFFVRAGEELSIKIPAGNYKLKYGAGDEWYGEEELFGPFSQYGESEVLQFIDHGYSSSGHTVSFYQQVDGNFHTNRIGRDSVLEN